MADADPPADDAPAPRRRLSRKVVIAGGVLASLGALGGAVALTTDSTPEPEVMFAQSLDMIRTGDWIRAHNVGVYLREVGYRDVNFGGGVEFVLGESSFHLGDAFSLDEHTRSEHYKESIRELKAAEQNGVPLAWRKSWTRSLGLSLFRQHRLAEAEPRLAEAVQDGDIVSMLALGECRLLPAADAPNRADDVAASCDALLARDDLTREQEVQASLLRIDAWFEQGRADDIERALTTTDWVPLPLDSPDLTLRRSRLALANSDPQEAQRLAGEVLKRRELPPQTLRAAAYWSARAAEMDGRDTLAILRYRAVLDDYDAGEESIVAAVRMADLLRLAPRVLFEDSLRAYTRAVQIESSPQHYRNRYMPLPELRRRVRTAWEEWLADGQFEWAIKLANQMAPLFERHEAAELAAEAAHQRALDAQDRFDAADAETRDLLRPPCLQRWRESGAAFAALADTLVADAGYQDALWSSFDHLRRGHDFEQAQTQLQAFLDTQTQTRRPQALVEYGRLLMDRHQPGDNLLREAAATFESVLLNYPTADSSFEARLSLGHCHLEDDNAEKAIADWKTLLASPLLTPDSRVWQTALVSLGDVLFHSGEAASLAARQAEQAGNEEAARAAFRQANQLWSDAAAQLTGYLARTGYDRRSAAARFWLAKSLQRTTELPQTQLGSAETNNARIELQRQIESSLQRAIAEFRSLVTELQPRFEQQRLDALERRLLRDCVFEIAHTSFLLGEHETAIDQYGHAINTFPNDPQVLLAYVQIASCYDTLGRRSEAISYLERAQLIRGQLSEQTFDPQLSSLSGPEWELWLRRHLELLNSPDS